MQKFIILLPRYFEKRDCDRFGIDFLKKNFLVKTIDCTAWRNPKLWKKCSASTIHSSDNIVISSKADVLNLLKTINPDIIIDYLDFDKKTNWIRKKIKKNNKNLLVYINVNHIPQQKINIKRSLKKLFLNPSNFFYSFFLFLKNKYYYLTKIKHDLCIIGGLYNNKLDAKETINAHNLDYDIYLNVKDRKDSSEDSYAVFLDESMPDHPDYISVNVKPPVNEDQYFRSLINFLKKFEKQTGLKVKFAVHPRSNYKKENLANLIKDIDYYEDNTAELVKNSKIVLLHCSTAVSYAILFKKPTIFLTSKELKKSWIGSKIDNFARILNSQPVYIERALSEQINLKNLFKIDEEKYQKYSDQYIKVPDSPNKPLWEIFTDFVKKNNSKGFINNF